MVLIWGKIEKISKWILKIIGSDWVGGVFLMVNENLL